MVAETSEWNGFAIDEKLPMARFTFSIKPAAFRLVIENVLRLAVRLRENRYDRDRAGPNLAAACRGKTFT
jgi:hypothetical protein